MSLASVFLEPLWVFVRADSIPRRLTELKGKHIAIGVPGSGTRVLAKTLLVASGIDDENSVFRSIGGAEAARALKIGQIDAAFFVTARLSDTVTKMIRDPAIRILDFDRADAYTRHYLYLSKLSLPEGLLSLDANIPPRNMDLLAPTAALVARNDLHPVIVDLVMGAANAVHRKNSLFSAAGAFPSPDFVDFPLSDDARRYFKSGPTFLRRVLPFWAAVLAERLLIMLVLLITIMIPLFKIAPPAYRWGVRRKIYRWYKELRDLESRVATAPDEAEPAQIAAELERIQAQVGRLKMPLSYAEQLYDLRLHIGYVKNLLHDMPKAAQPHPG
jgi:hypothetical protein